MQSAIGEFERVMIVEVIANEGAWDANKRAGCETAGGALTWRESHPGPAILSNKKPATIPINSTITKLVTGSAKSMAPIFEIQDLRLSKLASD